MKRISLLFIVIFLSQMLSAQVYMDWLSEESRNLILEGKECRKNRGENCLSYFKKAFSQAKNDKKCIPCAELQLVHQYYSMGETNFAYDHLREVFKGSEQLETVKKDEIQLPAYNLKGILESGMGDTELSIKSYLKAANLAEKMGREEQAASIQFNIAQLYFAQSNYKEANRILKKSYQIFTKLGAEMHYPILSGNIAGTYFGMNEIDSALIWGKKSMNFAKKQNDFPRLNYAFYVLSNSYFANNQLDSAFYYAELGIQTAKENSDLVGLAQNHEALAQVQLKNKEYSKAIRNFEASLDLKEGNSESLINKIVLYKDLGKAYLEVGEFKKSAIYLDQFIELNDSIASEEKQKLVHELNTQYETEKKEKQIAEQELKIQKQRANLLYAILGGALAISLLGGFFLYNRNAQKLKLKQLQQEKENAILNSFIQGEERERNRISHELHDGVAAMIGAAKMGLETIPHLPQEKQTEQLSKIKNILENTHADVRHIAHNLLPTVLEKEGIIKATEHFAREINETQLLNVSVLNENSKADEISHQLQLMLFRVIQELVNNIIKHSQAQNAVISFSRKENELQIEVSDDGIGYEGRIDTGNQGLYSISQRLKSIGGNFRFTKKNDRGMQAVAEVKV